MVADELAGLPNRYAAIVPARHAHHSGVFDSFPHVLDSIHFVEGLIHGSVTVPNSGVLLGPLPVALKRIAWRSNRHRRSQRERDQVAR